MNDFNTEQQVVIGSDARQIAVSAGPGSGKTRTLIGRLERLIEDGVDPRGIVVLTFTNAAAREIEHRLEAAIGNRMSQPLGFVGTLHSWLFLCLRRHGSAIGLPPNMAVIDEATADEILAETVKEHGYRGTKKELQEALTDVPFLLRSKGLIGARLVSAAYHLRLLQSGLMSYDGILAYGLHLIKSCGIERTGRPMWGSHILVDEVQDANPIDWQIYRAANFESKFFVGDGDQAIFGFRGSSPQGFIDLTNDSQTTSFRLTANYRSGADICRAANRLIGHNVNRIAKDIAPTKQGGLIHCDSFDNEYNQEKIYATQLYTCLEDRRTCAVLCRTNWQADEYADFLRAVGLPVHRVGDAFKPNPTPDWPKARLAVAFFANPENDLLAYQFVRMLRGDEVATAFRRKAALAMRSINQECLHFKAGLMAGMGEALARINLGKESIARVNELIAGLEGGATIADLSLAMVEPERLAPKEDGTVAVNPVHVSTIHSAKGKEWDCVFLPSWNQETFPAKASGDDLEEARRLAFVAVTRAKESVWIGCPKEGRTYAKATKPVALTPSRFVSELGLTVE